jgi:signal transduction histidine kinase
MRRWLPAAGPRALVAPAAAAAALLLASSWLADPRVGYVAGCVLATAVAAVAALRGSPPSLRMPLAVTLAPLAAFVVVAGRAELRLASFSRAPSAVAAAEADRQQTMLGGRVDDELRFLRRAAGRALAVASTPTDPEGTVVALERAIGRGARDRRAVLVARGDSLLAWAGTLHAEPRALTDPSGVVATPFGLTLYASADSAGRRAVATSLLYAAPPADRLTRGLAQQLPSTEVTEGFVFGPPGDTSQTTALRYRDGGRTLFVARALVPSAGEVRFRTLERTRVRAGIALLIAMVAFLVLVARREVDGVAVVAGVLVVLRCVTVVPLSEFSTRSRLFDAAVYFFPAGRAFTANAAALAVTAATLLFLVILVIRRVADRLPRSAAVLLAAATIGLGPFVVGALARGITPPAEGAGDALWLIWTVPLCLTATALLVLASWAGRIALGGRRGTPAGLGPALALVAAVVAPLAWHAPGQWPPWFSVLWSVAVGTLVLSRPSRRALLGAAMVAALASATVVWGATSRGRVELAERDVRGLAGPDAYGAALANRLASTLQGEELPRNAETLLERYVSSDLAASGYPVALTSWEGATPLATFGSAPFDVAFDTVGAAALGAQLTRQRISTTTRATSYGVHVVAVPVRGGAVTILVAPRTRLIGNDAYSRWYGLPPTQESEPLYTVQVVPEPLAPRSEIRWRREGNELHGDWPVAGATGPARAHVEVDLRGLDTLIPRGGLLVLVNIGAVLLVWLLGAVADGRVSRWLRLRRRRMRSYRTRLSLALALFFLVPAGAFALWSWGQLFDDAQTSRRLLVTETMRAVSANRQSDWLKRESARLDTKLLLYKSGVLVGASDSLFADLAPMGTLLRPDVAVQLGASEEISATRPEAVAGATGMLGYRVLPTVPGSDLVIAAPARVDDLLLDRRRRDLGVLVVFATALGAAAAVWLSGEAARQLARPIGALRTAARAVARGERDIQLAPSAMSEFVPVFSAFRAMAEDLATSRAELVEAQRRTDAVLRTVASGVIAVDDTGAVILANPRAELLLGRSLPAGSTLVEPPAVAVRVMRFLRSGADADHFELEFAGRALRGQLTRLSSGGAVLTLDDVTELVRAQRVLAWGEMARQVAHEIKNPLTPIRLGVQHLRRARGSSDFDTILEQNVSRILTEIDRLDEIARAFSRYGGAPEARAQAEPTNVVEVVQDVVGLETIGEGRVRWTCAVDGEVPFALARADELREVLLNLFENARLAEAKTVHTTVRRAATPDMGDSVMIEVTDDGVGIAADVLPRIFEPHFSTRTSGSGLGLAITRRLVESWGGEVTIESERGRGTTVRVALRAAGDTG